MPKNFIIQSLSLVFKDLLYLFLALSISFNLLAIYYVLFFQVTTLEVFFSSNTAVYNWTSIISTVLIAFLSGIAITLAIWQRKNQKIKNNIRVGNGVIGSFLGALSVGCPVCGAALPALLGIAGGLAAFPFQGLEIKAISLGLLIFSTVSLSKSISKKSCDACEQPSGDVLSKEKLFSFESEKVVLNVNWQTIKPIAPLLISIFLLVLVVSLPFVSNKLDFGFNFQKKVLVSNNSSGGASADAAALLEKITPPQGYEINASFGNAGPQLLEIGAINFEKIKALYEKSGNPLTQEQIKILTQGSSEKIKISPDNAYFLLNFLWALGLANKNPILDEGPIVQAGRDKLGQFASTGGWDQGRLGNVKSTEFFSKFEIIKLTSEQQKVLEDFAYNSYRPCCSNPTAFPDCNHGVAALALGEIMAAQGATADEIFEAFKYFNAFWFPQTYFDIATYFQAKEGKNWSEVSGRIVAGKDYSTPQGWQRVKQWLFANGYLKEAPTSGGGCGV